MKVSLLIPTRNDADKALQLVSDLHDCVDDIVLLDSSDGRERQKLLKAKARFSKLQVLHVIAMGYPEPVLKYGFNHCRNEWLLLLGTDERLNGKLKKELRSIPNAKNSAFAIKRYEEVHLDGSRTQFFTWQVRIFRKDKSTFKGLIHEQPIVNGRIDRLGDDFAIEHIVEEKGNSAKEYSKMEKFERFSYETFNDKVIDYAFKVAMPTQRNFRKTFLGKFIYGALRTYEALTFRKADEEISNFDYFTLYSLRDLAFQIKMRQFNAHRITHQHWEGIVGILPARIKYIKKIKRWRSAKNGKVIFEISREIGKIGITKYLRLDEDKTINILNKKYAGKKQGVGLLMKLLEDRYYGRYP